MAALALVLSAVWAGCADGKRELDSILLITVGTLRADHLSCYKPNFPVQTPNIDALARRGALLRRAWCTVPITAPSHASILSGLHPMAHGVRNNYRYRMPDEITTLAEVVKQAGGQKAAFLASYTVSREFGA